MYHLLRCQEADRERQRKLLKIAGWTMLTAGIGQLSDGPARIGSHGDFWDGFDIPDHHPAVLYTVVV